MLEIRRKQAPSLGVGKLASETNALGSWRSGEFFPLTFVGDTNDARDSCWAHGTEAARRNDRFGNVRLLHARDLALQLVGCILQAQVAQSSDPCSVVLFQARMQISFPAQLRVSRLARPDLKFVLIDMESLALQFQEPAEFGLRIADTQNN
jgi:hypothetical protein